MKHIASALLFSVLIGCASAPTVQQQASADYGSPIDQATAEAAALAYLRPRLKDPMSAIYEWKPVHPGYLTAAPIVGRKLIYGYILDGAVNSKNSFGGYTGLKPYQFIFRDGRIVHAAHQECLAGGGCYMAPF